MEHVDVGGVQIAYTRAGFGPPLVMLHGAPADSRTWQWMLPDLARRADSRPPLVVALGARRNDIEIGAGGLLVELADTWYGARPQGSCRGGLTRPGLQEMGG